MAGETGLCYEDQQNSNMGEIDQSPERQWLQWSGHENRKKTEHNYCERLSIQPFHCVLIVYYCTGCVDTVDAQHFRQLHNISRRI